MLEKTLTFINKVIHWTLFSSKDSAKVSLTIKSAFAGVAVIAGLFQLPLESFTDLQDATINLINSFFILASALGVFVGAFRKVKTTILGTNKVINEHKIQL